MQATKDRRSGIQVKWKSLIPPAAVYAALVFLLVRLWEHQILLSIALVLLFLLGHLLWTRKPYDWTLYVSTVALSLVVEVICVHCGAWTYAKPNLINIPSYIPLAYGVGLLALVKMVGTFHQVEAARRVSGKEIIVQLVGLALLVVLMAFLWRSSFLLTIALVGLAVALSRLWTRSDYDLSFYTVSFVLPPIIDITNIAEGVWRYGSDSIVWDIPLWLPFAYGVGLLLAVKVGLTVHTMFVPRITNVWRNLGGSLQRGGFFSPGPKL